MIELQLKCLFFLKTEGLEQRKIILKHLKQFYH